jgi:hypothetical protein
MKPIKTTNQKKQIYQLHSRAFDLLQRVESTLKHERARHKKQVGRLEAR